MSFEQTEHGFKWEGAPKLTFFFCMFCIAIQNHFWFKDLSLTHMKS